MAEPTGGSQETQGKVGLWDSKETVILCLAPVCGLIWALTDLELPSWAETGPGEC